MHKLNIENIFKCKTLGNKGKKLDIQSISNIKKPQFTTLNLIEHQHKKKEKVIKQYVKYYDMCLKQIQLANNLDKTDIFFSIPNNILGCNEYKSNDCIEYIKQKLEEHLFETFIINNTTIFITWHNIEEKTTSCQKS